MESLINLFSVGFYVFLAIAVIGIGLGVFTFFKFNIPNVVALMTGKAQRRSVESMKASGRLRSDAELEQDRTSADFKGTEGIRTEDYMTQEISPYSQTTVQDTSVLEPAQETVLLTPEQETTVLENAGQPVFFQVENDPETSVLGGRDPGRNGETQELNGNMYRPVGRSFGETEVLDRNAAPIPEVSFECTEHVMITHTDEVI